MLRFLNYTSQTFIPDQTGHVFLLTTFDATLNRSILITLTVGLARLAGLYQNVVA
jgi:3,4-dihydroxy-2-butanone 4-phosphate synthase